MSTARAECVSAPTEMKSTPVFGNRADVCQIHAAAGLGLRAAFDFLHRQPQLYRVHVVEQNDVRPASAACSTCSSVSASTSIFSFGNFSRARWTAAAMAFGFSSRSAAR